MAPRWSLFRVLALAVALGGCERYPEDPIFAYGEVQHADGSPRASLALTVERALPPLNPKPGDPPPDFQPYAEVTSGTDGRFILESLAGDTDVVEGKLEEFVPRFRLALPLEQGQSTWISFEQRDDVELPTLRAWDSGLTRVEALSGPALAFAAPPPVPPMPPTASVTSLIHEDGTSEPEVAPDPEATIQLLSHDQVLWQERKPTSPWTPTPWLLEDFASPEAQVRAHTEGTWGFSPLGATSGSLMFRMEWRSERLPWPAGALRPVSRGATCLPATPEACPWTDGELTPVLLNKLLDTYPRELGVALETPTRLSRAVIRGLDVSTSFDRPEEDLLILEGSVDGEQWTQLASVAPFQPEKITSIFSQTEHWTVDSPFDPPLRTAQHLLFLDIPLVDAPPMRQVRLFIQSARGDRGVLREVTELSLFE